MDAINDFIQLLLEQLSALDDLVAERYQLHVPDAESLPQIRIQIHVLQQLIALIDYLIVVVQIVKIEAVKLAELHVHEPPPLRRAVLDDPQILRREKDHIAQTHQIRRFLDLLPVDGNALGFTLPKVHVHPGLHAVLFQIGPDMGLLFVEAYDFPIL